MRNRSWLIVALLTPLVSSAQVTGPASSAPARSGAGIVTNVPNTPAVPSTPLAPSASNRSPSSSPTSGTFSILGQTGTATDTSTGVGVNANIFPTSNMPVTNVNTSVGMDFGLTNDQIRARDDMLARDIRAHLDRSPGIGPSISRLDIIPQDGAIILRGRVSSEAERADIERSVRDAAGGAPVRNETTVSPP